MGIRYIPLGKETSKHQGWLIMDSEDYDRFNLSGRAIYLKEMSRITMPNKYYAVFKQKKGRGSPQEKIHNFVMWSPDGHEIDHINGNTLDNRKENLRIVTRSENLQNKKSRSQHKERGITFKKDDKRIKKWVAEIHKNKKRYHLGYFLTKAEAVNARRDAEKIHFPNIFK